MEADARKIEMDALVKVIWGQPPPEPDDADDPERRELQNQALALAIRLYLQSYLDDMNR